MPKVKIKQMDGRTSTAGLHFGMGPLVPKLEPGEVVELPDDETFERLWATGKLELTRDAVTRPLKYANEQEARYCRPSYRVRDDSDRRDMNLAREAVAKRLAKTSKPEPKPKPKPETGDSPPAHEPPDPPPNRRALRRAAIARGGDDKDSAGS